MEESRKRNGDLPLILGYVEGIVEDCTVNVHVVVDRVVANIVSWVKRSSIGTDLRR